LLPALKKSIIGLREADTRGKSVQPVNEGRPARFATDVIAMLQDLADKGFLTEARERTS
jgi:hypothetical protein